MKIAGETNIGVTRKINQDNFLIIQNKDKTSCAFGVADGLGGHNAGEVASKMCVSSLWDFFYDHREISFMELKGQVEDEILMVNDEILKLSRMDEAKSGMGTTLTLCVAQGHKMFIAHVGDSRCYRLNPAGIEQVTKDHSLVEHMIENGDITVEEAVHHPNRNIITNAVGTNSSTYVEMYDVVLGQKDIILVCSDGLSEHVTEEKMLEVVLASPSLQQAVEALIKEANDRGGSDNITVVLCSQGDKE